MSTLEIQNGCQQGIVGKQNNNETKLGCKNVLYSSWQSQDDIFKLNEKYPKPEIKKDLLEFNPEERFGSSKISSGKLLMRFCPHDSSMLYPKEHKTSRILRYACRLCQYSEDTVNHLIYQNLIKKEVGNVLHTVPGAISDDPTLPRSHNASCENCGHHEAVFFQSDTGQSDSLALIFVCCNCDHKWVG